MSERTVYYMVYAFQINGDNPNIWNPDPCLARTKAQANKAVAQLKKDGFPAWWREVRVGRWR